MPIETLLGLVELHRKVRKATVNKVTAGLLKLTRHKWFAGEGVGLRHRLHRQHRVVYFFYRLFDAVSKGDALLVDAVVDLIQADHLAALLGGGDRVVFVGVGGILKVLHHTRAGRIAGHRLYLASVGKPLVFFNKFQRHQHLLDDEASVRQLMGRRQGVEVDIERRDPLAIREVVLHRVVDDVRRFDVVIAWGVIAKLEPPYTTEKGVEDALLHLGLSVHLLQRRISDAL